MAMPTPTKSASTTTSDTSSTSNILPRSDADADADADPNATRPLSDPDRPIFTQETVRTLRRWYTANKNHPYPTSEEKEELCLITGLNRTQVATWFANTRRRNHIGQPWRRPVPATTSPSDVPPRPETPGIFEDMDPFQRWANSPPEDEPAEAMAIRKAANEPFYSWNSPVDDLDPCSTSASDSRKGSSQESFDSSASSSFSFSPHLPESSVLHHLHHRRRRRRRRRNNSDQQHRASPRSNLAASLRKVFQCTFCAEEFGTKYDWQRHEKTWHISLDRWICALTGPHLSPDNKSDTLVCVFCREKEPDAAHLELHNFSICNQRSAEHRTFYRRDHLFQHLRLVHRAEGISNTDFDIWKITSPGIRSRCGFCGQNLPDWLTRVEHLGQHFKAGCTMAEWVGDWGFDAAILPTIENSMPPYLLGNERNSPLPYKANNSSPWTPSTAYDLLKMELSYWIMNHLDTENTQPSDMQIRNEACRIIHAADLVTVSVNPYNDHSVPNPVNASWLRDIITASPEALLWSTNGMVRGQADNRLTTLRVNGKDDIFEDCGLERQLRAVCLRKIGSQAGIFIPDKVLQANAAHIVRQAEVQSSVPSDVVAKWLQRMIFASTDWLTGIRSRITESQLTTQITSPKETSEWASRLEAVARSQEASLELTNDTADLIVPVPSFNFTTNSEMETLWALDVSDDGTNKSVMAPTYPAEEPYLTRSHNTTFHTPTFMNNTTGELATAVATSMRPPYFPNDANTYHRLARDLARFVAAALSDKNPNRHVPTDKEIQYQARWFEFNDDDPWNQTAADHPEWLMRFKRDVGLLPPDSGPGLELGCLMLKDKGMRTGWL